jgi:dynein heavy chain
VRDIHAEFVKAVETVRALPYDLMDVSVPAFDDDFYRFRQRVKDLERRLAALLLSAFDDCVTMETRFKLFDTFDGFLDRCAAHCACHARLCVLMHAVRSQTHHS